MIILLILITGIAAGALLRNNKRIIKISEHLTDWFIYILLFFLGLSVSSSGKLLQNIGPLGIQVTIITFAAILGSLIAGLLVYKKFFLRKK